MLLVNKEYERRCCLSRPLSELVDNRESMSVFPIAYSYVYQEGIPYFRLANPARLLCLTLGAPASPTALPGEAAVNDAGEITVHPLKIKPPEAQPLFTLSSILSLLAARKTAPRCQCHATIFFYFPSLQRK